MNNYFSKGTAASLFSFRSLGKEKTAAGNIPLPLFQSRNHEKSLIVSGDHDSAGIRPDQSCSIFEPDCMVRSAGIALRV